MRRTIACLVTGAVLAVASPPAASAGSPNPPTQSTTTEVKKEIGASIFTESGAGGWGCYWVTVLQFPHVRDAVRYELHWTDYLNGGAGAAQSASAPPFYGEIGATPAGAHRLGLTGGTSGSFAGGYVDPSSCGGDPSGGKRFKLGPAYAILGERSCDGKPVPKGKFVVEGTVAYASESVLGGSNLPDSGVTIKLSGPSASSATTDEGGNYCAVVSKGRYVIKPEGGQIKYAPAQQTVAVTGDKGGVDFHRAAHRIDGTVRDGAGKPAANVSVRIIGRGGKVVTTDSAGNFQAEVANGSYTVVASKRVEVQQTDASGKAITSSRLEYFCHADQPNGCPKTRTVAVPPDQTLTFGQGCDITP